MRTRKMMAWAMAALLGSAMAAHADTLDEVAERLAKGADQLQGRRVAVFDFSYPNGDISTGSFYVAEGLITRLVGRKHISVVERSQLAKLLSEAKFELSGVTESSSTPKLGRVLGVDAIVTGTLIDLANNKTEVNARLIAADTGEVIAAASESIDRTWDDAPHQPPSQASADGGEVHYMSPLIPVARGFYGVPPPRRRLSD